MGYEDVGLLVLLIIGLAALAIVVQWMAEASHAEHLSLTPEDQFEAWKDRF